VNKTAVVLGSRSGRFFERIRVTGRGMAEVAWLECERQFPDSIQESLSLTRSSSPLLQLQLAVHNVQDWEDLDDRRGN